jgi:hypothetical protein
LFSSVNALHCTTLLAEATLNFAVFWSNQMLTSLREKGASALPPLTIFHSLSALQRWLHCTQNRHRPQASRRGCILAQHRRSAMTRSPALLPLKKNRSCSWCRKRGRIGLKPRISCRTCGKRNRGFGDEPPRF